METWQCGNRTRPTLLGVSHLFSEQDMGNVFRAVACSKAPPQVKHTLGRMKGGKDSPGCAALHSLSLLAVQ